MNSPKKLFESAQRTLENLSSHYSNDNLNSDSK